MPRPLTRDHRRIHARLHDHALVVFEQTTSGRAALSCALERARREGTELTVLHAMPYERVDTGCASCRHGAAIWNREMRYDAEEALAEARELVGDDASVTHLIAKGQGAGEIARASREAHADLIVLPSPRLTRLPRFACASRVDGLRARGGWDVAVAPAAIGSEGGGAGLTAAEWRRLRR
ncbi:MAG: universal stress protein, partial [Actinomycetota bacterium]|nr:universal stress protein [Actinomycetota bacterium]